MVPGRFIRDDRSAVLYLQGLPRQPLLYKGRSRSEGSKNKFFEKKEVEIFAVVEKVATFATAFEKSTVLTNRLRVYNKGA
ncbi:hypothetical protein B5E60_12420 [Alistipes sp. An116]|nr:hypothetical protein B5E60_12420 [Alistipes sp. An116]